MSNTEGILKYKISYEHIITKSPLNPGIKHPSGYLIAKLKQSTVHCIYYTLFLYRKYSKFLFILYVFCPHPATKNIQIFLSKHCIYVQKITLLFPLQAKENIGR